MPANLCRTAQLDFLTRLMGNEEYHYLIRAHSPTALARLLGMSLRTLQRRVDALGTSVRTLIDEVRAATARQLLDFARPGATTTGRCEPTALLERLGRTLRRVIFTSPDDVKSMWVLILRRVSTAIPSAQRQKRRMPASSRGMNSV